MDTKKFNTLLEKAVAFHGHLCAGQIIGVRMAMLGLNELELYDIEGVDRRKLIVFVEIDRCATDAIMTVTGCRLGRRSMKVMDYGKMAATFINIDIGRAVRITTRQDCRQLAREMYPHLSAMEAEKRAYGELEDDLLFEVQDVIVELAPEDLPGSPLGKTTCSICKETILDKRERFFHGKPICRSCAAGGSYYTVRDGCRRPHPRSHAASVSSTSPSYP